MILVLAMLLQGYFHREPRVTQVVQHGSFVVEREDVIVRNDLPVLHEALIFPKARLIWSSADGLVQARYEDNGAYLSLDFRMSRQRRDGPDFDCHLSGGYTAYGRRIGGEETWKRAVPAFRKALADCYFNAARTAAYEAEFTAAAPLFGEANSAFRSLALDMFKGLRRCVRNRYRFSMGYQQTECSRWSDPV
jgi:hypothetical protein